MEQEWTSVCELSDLIPDTGICVKLGSYQAAIFYVAQTKELFAIGNYDPLGNANVLSRGLISSIGERLTVASPLYKQHYDLRTGVCLENDSVSVPCFPLRVEGTQVQLSAPIASEDSQQAA